LPVQKITADRRLDTHDPIVVEEPLEIRLEYGPAGARTEQPVSITMRTPGQDDELAVGFLFSEGILPDAHALKATRGNGNTIVVSLHESVTPDIGRLQRSFYTTSSCGVCGKTSVGSLYKIPPKKINQQLQIEAETLYSLPALLREGQDLFESTGGLHAAGLFDHEGRLLAVREDIGRHNALDKLIGHFLQQEQLPKNDSILLLSGRACFELIQKAAMAGIRMVAAVGPPSSLAVELANEAGITLVGFLRQQRFNIYSGAERIK
jgi:FdhD protein